MKKKKKPIPRVLKVLNKYKQGPLIISTPEITDKKIYVERVVKRIGFNDRFIKVSHEEEISVNFLTQIKDPNSGKVLWKKRL